MPQWAQALRNNKIFIIATIIGLTLTAVLLLVMNEHNHQKKVDAFKRLSEERFISLERKLSYSFSALNSLKAFYKSSESVNRREFKIFAKSILKIHPEIQALEWVPAITHKTKKQYIDKAIEDGFTHFQLREKNAQGKLVKVKKRERYYPVFYVEPLKGNEQALGYDLASNDNRQEALLRSARTNSLVITRPISLVQDEEKKQSILGFLPIYNETHNAQHQHAFAGLTGYVIIVLKMDTLYQHAINNSLHTKPITLSIIDFNSDQTIIGEHPSTIKEHFFHNKKMIHIGQRKWLISIFAKENFFTYSSVFPQKFILIFGILVSILIALYSQQKSRQQRYIRNQVTLRTKELKHNKAYYKAVINTAADAIISMNEQGTITRFNKGAESLFNYAANEVIGLNVSMLMPHEHASQHNQYIEKYLTTGIAKIIGKSREVSIQRADGSLIPAHLSITDTGIAGEMRFTAIIRDLSDLHKVRAALEEHQNHLEEVIEERTSALQAANEQLKKLSEIDPLTQIANRRLYEVRLSAEIANARRNDNSLALIMIDIDHFKEYNDCYGHDLGDITLHRVAQSIAQTLPRDTDFAARFGGEEFIALLPMTDAKGALLVAERIRIYIKALAIPHKSNSEGKVVTVSLGVAAMTGEALNETDLLKQADQALYQSKENGRNQSSVHNA